MKFTFSPSRLVVLGIRKDNEIMVSKPDENLGPVCLHKIHGIESYVGIHIISG